MAARPLRSLAAVFPPPPAGVFALPGRADAHTTFVGSEPSDGAFVDAAPERVRLRFSEEIAASASRAWLVTAAGDRADLVVVAGVAASELVVALPGSASGVVQVGFSAIGTEDLHRVSGTVTIGIGEPAVMFRGPPRPAPPAVAEIVGRFLVFLGLALVVGAPALLWVLSTVPAGTALGRTLRRRRRRFPRLVYAGCSAVGVGELFELARSARALGIGRGGAGLVSVLGTGPARNAMTALVLVAVVARGADRLGGRLVNAEQLVVAAALSGVVSGSAHPMSLPAAVARLVGTVHVVGVSAWVGALTIAVVVLADADRNAFVAVLRAYAPVALIAAGASVVSGAMMAVRHVPSFHLATSTAYGQALSAKLAAVTAVVVIGVRRERRHRAGRVRRVTPVAVLAGVAALWGAAALTATAPASAEPAPAPLAQPPRVVTEERADLRVTTVLSGAGHGAGSVVVKPRATASDAGGIGQLVVRVTGSALAAPVEGSPEPRNGGFEVPVTIARPGAVVVTTEVHRAARGDHTFTSTLYIVEPQRVPRLLLPVARTRAAGRLLAAAGFAVIIGAIWRRQRFAGALRVGVR